MKNKRIIPVLVVVAVTVFIMWWIYGSEYHYPNTESGRLAAVEDYVLSTSSIPTRNDLSIGTPMYVEAWQKIENRLYVFFRADNQYNSHGILELKKGWNGKYMPLQMNVSPSQYMAGIYFFRFSPKELNREYFILAAIKEDPIASETITFSVNNYYDLMQEPVEKQYDIRENFLLITDNKTMIEELGFQYRDGMGLYVEDRQLYDKHGNDITDSYRDETISLSAGGYSQVTAETFVIYLAVGFIAFFGVLIARFIWTEWK